MNFKIREANSNDASFIHDCQMKMAFESEGMQLDAVVLAKGIQAVFDGKANGVYYLACSGDQPIACVMILTEWSDWRNATVLWIHSLYVVPEFRKQKVFSSIYSYLKTKVEKAEDLKGLRLYVDQKNLPAIRAYEKVGMTQEHYAMFEWMK